MRDQTRLDFAVRIDFRLCWLQLRQPAEIQCAAYVTREPLQRATLPQQANRAAGKGREQRLAAVTLLSGTHPPTVESATWQTQCASFDMAQSSSELLTDLLGTLCLPTAWAGTRHVTKPRCIRGRFLFRALPAISTPSESLPPRVRPLGPSLSLIWALESISLRPLQEREQKAHKFKQKTCCTDCTFQSRRPNHTRPRVSHYPIALTTHLYFVLEALHEVHRGDASRSRLCKLLQALVGRPLVLLRP